MEQILTKKKPLGLIFKFTMPLLGVNLIDQLCYIVNYIFISSFAGSQALAGFGIASTIEYIMYGFAYGACSGFCIVLAQNFGAKNKKGVKFSVASAFYLYIGFVTFFSIFGFISTNSILNLMNTPKNIFKFAYDYLIIVSFGNFSQIGYIFLNEMLKSVGDNKTPLFILIFNASLNIVLSFFLIYVFKTQTKGAAIATVIAQTISCILCLIFIYKKFKFLVPKKKEWRFKKHYILTEIKIGLPIALVLSIVALGMIILQKAVNSFGENVIAGFAIASNIENLIITAITALATTTSTFTAQNFGAKKFKRIVKGAKASFLIGMGFCLIFALMIFFLWDQISWLFLNSSAINPASKKIIKNVAKLCLNMTAFNCPILCLLLMIKALIEAMGKTLITFLIFIFYFLIQLFGSIVFPKMFGYIGVCFAPVASWYVAFILAVIALFYNIRKLKKIKPL